MQVAIHAKNLELNATLRAFIEEKMADLERLLGEAGQALARVEVSIPSQRHQSGQIFRAEVNIDLNGTVLRAEATNFDMHAALVDVKDQLKSQIKKFKERRSP